MSSYGCRLQRKRPFAGKMPQKVSNLNLCTGSPWLWTDRIDDARDFREGRKLLLPHQFVKKEYLILT
jgi:hypothetical protein